MDTVLIDGAIVTVLPSRVRAMSVHDAKECAGRECVIHAPTDHSMRHLPLHWRADRGIFERICEHACGHPDPDQRAYWREVGYALADYENEHDPLYAFGDRIVEPLTEEQRVKAADEYVSEQMTHGCCGYMCCAGSTS